MPGQIAAMGFPFTTSTSSSNQNGKALRREAPYAHGGGHEDNREGKHTKCCPDARPDRGNGLPVHDIDELLLHHPHRRGAQVLLLLLQLLTLLAPGPTVCHSVRRLDVALHLRDREGGLRAGLTVPLRTCLQSRGA